jgi:hypothetical protein
VGRLVEGDGDDGRDRDQEDRANNYFFRNNFC